MDKLQEQCKECLSSLCSLRYRRKRQFCSKKCRVRFNNKNWAKNNRAKVNTTRKAWEQKNPEKVKKHKAAMNRLLAESKKEWTKRNKDCVNARTQRYRAKKRNLGESFTSQEWKELKARFKYLCLSCKKHENVVGTLEADHVIPVFFNGVSTIDNIQPLCRSCNARKRTKYIDYRLNFEAINTERNESATELYSGNEC